MPDLCNKMSLRTHVIRRAVLPRIVCKVVVYLRDDCPGQYACDEDDCASG
jgi:hypothetical protein